MSFGNMEVVQVGVLWKEFLLRNSQYQFHGIRTSVCKVIMFEVWV